jgi:hypothetical protein
VKTLSNQPKRDLFWLPLGAALLLLLSAHALAALAGRLAVPRVPADGGEAQG